VHPVSVDTTTSGLFSTSGPGALAPARRWWFGARDKPDTPGLGDREALFCALYDNARDGLFVCTNDGTVLSCNAAACQLIGGTAESIVGRHVAHWVSQDDSAHGKRGVLRSGDAVVRNGKVGRPVQLQISRFEAPDGKRVVVRVTDGAERAEAQERLERLANYDTLTGLPNRALFRDRLALAMARAQRDGAPMALLFLDLDRFKTINDGLGHEAGDKLLLHVADKLRHCLRASDSLSREGGREPPLHTLSRLGGDEFTVILESIGSAEDAAHVARRMLEALAEPFVIGEEEIVTSASIGISMYPTDDVDLDGLIRHTDMAMYRSKSLGRGTYSFFSDELNSAVACRVSLEGHLRRAVGARSSSCTTSPRRTCATARSPGSRPCCAGSARARAWYLPIASSTCWRTPA
jgi:diguanylate cyclase (GGDEF)-like protein/PAS domain S-box-containing protein